MMNLKSKATLITYVLIRSKHLIIILCFPTLAFSQKINRKNYLKEEKVIWSLYKTSNENLDELIKKSPDKEYSIYQLKDETLQTALKELLN